MTAKQFLKKYPLVEKLVEKVVSDSKARGSSSDQTIRQLQQKFLLNFGMKLPRETAVVLLIA